MRPSREPPRTKARRTRRCSAASGAIETELPKIAPRSHPCPHRGRSIATGAAGAAHNGATPDPPKATEEARQHDGGPR